MRKAVMVMALILWAGRLSHAQGVPIDLRTWREEGPPANGTWTVSADGASVLQTINGDPTFFVSPDNYFNTTIQGKFKVETTSDDDFIGFVFGYQSPIAANNDPTNKFNFLLFDWKQTTQASGGATAQEGFNLARVNGRFTNFIPGFWGHASSDTFQVLATDYGANKGWQDNTEYTFELVYQASRIKISIDGATIFDVTGDFPAGRFGFYNYSQQSVRYQSFTQGPTQVCWLNENFDNLRLGCLDGQNGWFVVPGRSCANVAGNPCGTGNGLFMDAGPNQTVIMGKSVNQQNSGTHSVEIAVRVENPRDESLAKIEIRTNGNPNWDKKFQLYFGSHMRLNYGPTLPEAAVFLPSVVSGRCYRVKATFDLSTNLVEVFLDGARVLQGIKIGPGPITDISVSAWDRPGLVYFDDIRG